MTASGERAADPAELAARLGELTLRDEHRLGRRLERLRRRKAGGAELAALAAHIDTAAERVERRRRSVPAVTYPPQLPVSARREDLLAAIRDHQVVVVAGETGSGKTTQLPKLCLELGRGVRGTIGHTQPRRIAARSVAERIAEELGVGLGEAVGYAVRFSDRSREDTLVRVMTDGLLLAEIQHDPLLRRYDTLIVDEAHERSLNIDFLLGYVARILPQRPDLKLVITSATIDPERFSRHFGDAPVVEVSGRTYPVEVRYRPLEDDADQTDAIAAAVDELMREGPGDVLVFLSGEREIRDTAEALAGTLRPGAEVLPLYARLSSAEQQRVFKPHRARRIVLATNVAETSLTVPGIRYVVDPGTARISRYSARLKVQRLPIEPISQASADQRKGRCGRTSDGICVRLYGEEDFEARPRFTDPEILRTSLAAVILQMAAAGLGEVEDFPFLDPPDRRQVRDGIALLEELGALDPGATEPGRRLTALGRSLAQLPVDPRLGRMVLAAGRLGCADEVIVIAAALSIQDPRERPAERRAAADQAHARFAASGSDFLALVELWRHLRDQQRALSGSAFRRLCRAEFLHFLRVREWQDLVGQLRQAAKGAGVTAQREPAEPDAVHQALLAGLLSHVGLRDPRGREYQGARGARFALWPGSALARRQPAWVMVAELVETSRLWGRTAARVQPSWIEPLAGHLLRRSYAEPRWDRRRAQVVATERATLYGLPVVDGRTVAYGRIDPVVARELFIRRALVEREWDSRHAFLAENDRRLEEVDALEARARRRDIRVTDDVLFAFYDERLPPEIVSGAHFDRWWRDEHRNDPERLTFPRELLVAGEVDGAGRPTTWRQGDLTLDLSYSFDPGTAHDGVTVHVPLTALGTLEPDGFEWLVPAFRHELVTTLIRTLPKELRRTLVPAPEVAAQVLERVDPEGEGLLDALERVLPRVPRSAWDPGRLPAYLRVTFRVEDEDGAPLAQGDDLVRLRSELRPRLRARLAAASPGLERSGLRDWTIATLPREVALAGALRAYPALVDEGDGVAVRLLDTPEAQAAAMRAGTLRLLALSVPSPLRWVQDRLDMKAQLAVAAAPHGSVRAFLEDAMAAAIEVLMDQAGGPVWDEAGWRALRDHVAGNLAAGTRGVAGRAIAVLDRAREVELALDALSAQQFADARHDVRVQLRRLVRPGFIAAAGVRRLPDLERYLRGALRRLERLPAAPGVDADRMRTVRELEAAHRRLLDGRPPGRPLPEPLRELPWLLEELRVSQFAQALGTRGGPVSVKRVRRALDEAAAAVG